MITFVPIGHRKRKKGIVRSITNDTAHVVVGWKVYAVPISSHPAPDALRQQGSTRPASPGQGAKFGSR